MAIKIDEQLMLDDYSAGLKVGTTDDNIKISDEESRSVDLYASFRDVNRIPPEKYIGKDIKRGLRNQDGTGVVVGLTQISSITGYELQDGKVIPKEGSVKIRGHELSSLIGTPDESERFNFEKVAYLLLMGKIPNKEELEAFISVIDSQRELPDEFVASAIMHDAVPNIMNMLSRSVLHLYSYDKHAEERSSAHEIHTALSLISRIPRIMVLSYYSKRATFFHESMIMHRFIEGQSTSETILSMLRPDREFTQKEARLLDVMLCIHAEHGGGNNSSFTTRMLSSADTDPYSVYSAAIGSLKGYRHGGANHKVRAMHADMREKIPENKLDDEGAVADYLRRVVNKEAYDRTGLIYGMGHAVYTLSDPRSVILKKYAQQMARGTEFEQEYKMLETIEKVSPEIISSKHKSAGPICANVDMYSGFVYSMIGIPEDLFTPLFACGRMAGWSAHRFEEIISGKRIMRPAYGNALEDN